MRTSDRFLHAAEGAAKSALGHTRKGRRPDAGNARPVRMANTIHFFFFLRKRIHIVYPYVFETYDFFCLWNAIPWSLHFLFILM